MRIAGAWLNVLLGLTFAFMAARWFDRGETGWGVTGAILSVLNFALAGVKFRGGEVPPAIGPPGPGTVTVELRMEGDRVLDAIKALREAVPGLGLKEAKDVVDAARASGTASLTAGATPEQREGIRRSLADSGSGLTVV